MFELRMTYPATKQLVERYTCGDCYILAPELSKLTGWKVAILHNSKNSYLKNPNAWYSCHVFCISPCGQWALDINGLTPLKEMKSEWIDKCGAKTLYVCEDLDDYQGVLDVWPKASSYDKRLARQTARRICDKILHPKE